MKFWENRQYINLGKYKKRFRPIFITYANTAYLRTIAVKLTALVLLVLSYLYIRENLLEANCSRLSYVFVSTSTITKVLKPTT